MNDSKHEITVTVICGRCREPKSFPFPKETKIADVAKKAGSAFGYPADQAFEVVRESDGSVLDGDRPLVSYHIEDGETLILSATGSGV